MENQDLSSKKHGLRKRIRARLQTIDLAERGRASNEIVERLASLLSEVSAQHGGRVLFYSAMPSEADVSSLMERRPELSFALPRVVLGGPSSRMTLHQVGKPGTDLVPGAFGVREPDVDRCPELPAGAFDVVVVPGMAFTPSGERLGKGGGYYDRLLSDPDLRALTIGVCFECQIVEMLPLEAHDHAVDRVVTEARVIG